MKKLIAEIQKCTICAEHLPCGPRPVIQADASARILIVGQAPGRRVHESGIPFDDPSGDRLRDWMGVSKAAFYNPKICAIVPMGFCYPGTGKSGDLPPRKECAPKWRELVLAQLHKVELTLVIGQYALAYHLPNEKGNLTNIVKNWQSHFPKILPLPHPSPRNNLWLKRNAWFEQDVLPNLRSRVNALLEHKT